jgi:hypothetical protein
MPEFVLADFVTGGILFGKTGYFISDPTKFYWDDTNFRLGILNNSPSASLDIGASHQFQVSSAGVVTLNPGAAGVMVIYDAAGTNYYTLTTSSIAANAALTLPAITGADTLAVLNLGQSFTQTQQFHQINPTTDNTYANGTNALRWSQVHGVIFNVEATASDANPTAQLASGVLKFGPGGSSAVDIALARVTGPAIQVQGPLQIQGTNGSAATGNQISTGSLGSSSTALYIGNAQILVSTSGTFVASLNTLTGALAITSPNSTLSVSTAAGTNVTIDINLSHANSWNAVQTFGNNISFGGYVLNVSSPSSGQVLEFNGTNWVNATLTGDTTVASASDTQLTTTSSTNVINYTPASNGNYLVFIYYRITNATTTISLTATWTDNSGSQTYTFLSTESQIVQSYAVLPLMVNANTGGNIIVAAQAGTANNIYISATVVKT